MTGHWIVNFFSSRISSAAELKLLSKSYCQVGYKDGFVFN